MRLLLIKETQSVRSTFTGGLYLLCEDNLNLDLHDSWNMDESFWARAYTFPITSFIGLLISEGTPVFFSASDPLPAEIQNIHIHEGVRASAFIPLHYGNRVIGCIYAFDDETAYFNVEQRRWLEKLAKRFELVLPK
jgi:transcriptional regulator with GAF, ATPase, and Fis domain